jgi:hypothetical protein
MYLLLANTVTSAFFRANAVFVASVVANPVKSDVFAFLELMLLRLLLELMPYS